MEAKMDKRISYIKGEQKKIARMVTREFKNYYLTGGTALSFYFGHRFSEDLDFFTQAYKKKDPDRIMSFVSRETGFEFRLEAEQDDPKLIPMKVYFLELERDCVLKMDFVQDFEENIKGIKNGLHSVEDIYFRKLNTAVGGGTKRDITGRIMAAGRQTAKDLFDVYYLSKHFKRVSGFFLEHFPVRKAENLIAWYRSFNRLELKLELSDLSARVDSGKVLRHLDDEVLRVLPDKLLS